MAFRRELNLLLLAVGFLTRLPVTWELDYNAHTLNASSRYFTLVGSMLGVCMAGVYLATAAVLPETVAVLLVIATNVLLTGCFHQDGLADMADGFGGAFERQRKLDIMKDSRLGTYGSTALIMTLAMNYILLLELDDLVVAVIIGQAVSRSLAASIIYNTPYAANPEDSKAKPLSQSMSLTDLLVLLGSAVLLVLLLLPAPLVLMVTGVLVLLRWLFKRFITAQIGGYTGDCLGAAQQLSEIAIYLTLLIWQGQSA